MIMLSPKDGSIEEITRLFAQAYSHSKPSKNKKESMRRAQRIFSLAEQRGYEHTQRLKKLFSNTLKSENLDAIEPCLTTLFEFISQDECLLMIQGFSQQ